MEDSFSTDRDGEKWFLDDSSPLHLLCTLLLLLLFLLVGFPCGSAGKEFACNAGDLGSIPGLGRSPGEGIGYPLQCPWASLVAQIVNNPLTMLETWVQSLG